VSDHGVEIERYWREVDESRAAFREQIAEIEREWAAMAPEARVSEAEFRAQIEEAERVFEERLNEVEWDIVDADLDGAKPPLGNGTGLGQGIFVATTEPG